MTPNVNASLDWLKQTVLTPSTFVPASFVHASWALVCPAALAIPGVTDGFTAVLATPVHAPNDACITAPISEICCGVPFAAVVITTGGYGSDVLHCS
jgi:hypothetical protein